MTGNNPVTIEQILKRNDMRLNLQTEFLKLASCVISFSLNIPGKNKTSESILKCFYEGKKIITNTIESCGYRIVKSRLLVLITGPEYIAAVDGEPAEIKKLMLQIEEMVSVGRLWDIDVIGRGPIKISRIDQGFKRRKCFICSEDAAVCRRFGRHTEQELCEFVTNLINDYFYEKYAEKIAETALCAMLTEVAITPKPGLVDRYSNGAHSDMDYISFQRSAAAVQKWLYHFVRAGISLRSVPTEQLFLRLRLLGQQAEKDMFNATKGVNTHKGLIFSFGIICGALGKLYGSIINEHSLFETCKEIAVHALSDFEKTTNRQSHGLELYKNKGTGGVRAEAGSGFLSVRKYGLPAFKNALEKGFSQNDAGVFAFIVLMENVEDSNVLYRSGQEGLSFMRESAERLKNQIIENKKLPHLDELDRIFADRNISAGGCADLLAVTLMAYYVLEY